MIAATVCGRVGCSVAPTNRKLFPQHDKTGCRAGYIRPFTLSGEPIRMDYTLLKYIHVLGAIILVGSVFTIDMMTLRLILARRGPNLKVYYVESKFIERGIIVPSSVITLLSGIIMAVRWFGWPFWLSWGLFVIAFTGFTGSVTIPRTKSRLVDLINGPAGQDAAIRRFTARFALFITVDLVLLFSAVGTMVYKPVF